MLYIAADHRGYHLKEKIKAWLAEWGKEFEDFGAQTMNLEDDYPDFARAVAEKIAGSGGQGILVCGSGVGMDISANRFKGVRCGLAVSPDQVQAARRDDDINILAIAADFMSEKEIKTAIKAFFDTEFSGIERYRRRISNIDA